VQYLASVSSNFLLWIWIQPAAPLLDCGLFLFRASVAPVLHCRMTIATIQGILHFEKSNPKEGMVETKKPAASNQRAFAFPTQS
jgi:hypothetical protein